MRKQAVDLLGRSLAKLAEGDLRAAIGTRFPGTVSVRQMDEMTQQNAALVEEINASIEQTEAQAAELDGLVAQFVITEGDGLRVAA